MAVAITITIPVAVAVSISIAISVTINIADTHLDGRGWRQGHPCPCYLPVIAFCDVLRVEALSLTITATNRDNQGGIARLRPVAVTIAIMLTIAILMYYRHGGARRIQHDYKGCSYLGGSNPRGGDVMRRSYFLSARHVMMAVAVTLVAGSAVRFVGVLRGVIMLPSGHICLYYNLCLVPNK
jgi:hypothetical protein